MVVDQGSARMALPTTVRVQSCMGCIPLQRGTIILGFLGLFCSLIELFRWIFVLVDFEQFLRRCQEGKVISRSTIVDVDVSLQNQTVFYDDEGDDDEEEGLLSSRKCPRGNVALAVRFVMILTAGVFFINIIVTALMIHGAKMGKPNLMVPWLWWQLAEIALAVLGLFGLGRGYDDFFTNIFIIIMTMYFFLVVNSYYQQLREEAACASGMTVVAVTRPREEMTVTIPSPRKDDPPPPYPSFTSGYNSAYNPSDSTGFPNAPAPPYTPRQSYPDSPPPYAASCPYQSSQVTQTMPVNQELYSSGNASNGPSVASGEVTPLVENSHCHGTKPNQM